MAHRSEISDNCCLTIRLEIANHLISESDRREDRYHTAQYSSTHGRKSRGTRGTSPPEFGVGEDGDANANCPSDFVIFQNFKPQIA